jgi:hypothetical protein
MTRLAIGHTITEPALVPHRTFESHRAPLSQSELYQGRAQLALRATRASNAMSTASMCFSLIVARRSRNQPFVR